MSGLEYLKLHYEMDEKFTNELIKEKCSNCEFKYNCEPMRYPTHDCYSSIIFDVLDKIIQWREPFWNDKLKEEVNNIVYGRRK